MAQLRELLELLREHWRSILTVHLIFVLLGVILLTPLFSALLQALVSLSGKLLTNRPANASTGAHH